MHNGQFKLHFLVLIFPLRARWGEYHDSVGVIISFSSEIKSPQEVTARQIVILHPASPDCPLESFYQKLSF